MSGLDYRAWVAEALLSVVPRAVRLVAEHGLPEGHALYISFDTRHPKLRLDDGIRREYPEVMTVVLENQFWDLAADDDGFSVTLAFGGRREQLYVPWSAVVAFADPPAEFAFDTSGQVSQEIRRLVGESSDAGAPEVAGDEESTTQFAAGERESRPSRTGSPAGRVVPFARPSGGVSANSPDEDEVDGESDEE